MQLKKTDVLTGKKKKKDESPEEFQTCGVSVQCQPEAE